jgi:hypothetical protein
VRIIDTTKATVLPKVLTMDIPVGQVFRGVILGNNSERWVSGVFYKAWGAFRAQGKAHEAVIVRLDVPLMSPGFANVILYDTWVREYEPLDVELVIKGVLS